MESLIVQSDVMVGACVQAWEARLRTARPALLVGLPDDGNELKMHCTSLFNSRQNTQEAE